MTADDIDEYVLIFGEQHRKLIADSLEWLEKREKHWDIVVDRDEFLSSLIDHAVDIGDKK